MDELAHTNAPGSRHPKRYQDVEELLDAGIDVYTTLNIQHLESLNDVVAQITGMMVRETVPDRVIDSVNEIELVDLPPDELLKRLPEGKVYVPEQAQARHRAILPQGQSHRPARDDDAPRCRTGGRPDACSICAPAPSPVPGPPANACWSASAPAHSGERLIRTTRRLADELNAEWFAVYVETPDDVRISQEQRDQVARSLRLAEELGARTVSRPGQSVARIRA